MSDQEIIDKQAVKIDTQRAIIDDKKTEIQKLHDRMELLDQADIKNFEQHREMMQKMDNISKTLNPICETYRSVGLMAKWLMAFLVFLSILGGIIWTWINIFKSKI